MRNNLPNYVAFAVLATALLVCWYVFGIDQKLFPQPERKVPPPTAHKDALAAAVGGVAVAGPFPKPTPPPVVAPAPKPVAPTDPPAYIALGDDGFNLKVLLTTTGAGVQQVVLTRFDESSRLGREYKDAAGKTRQLHLIPGYKRPLPRYVSDEAEYVTLTPNLTADQFAAKQKPAAMPFTSRLTRPSYTILHYPAKDDPARPLDAKGKPMVEDDNYPLATLAERQWRLVKVAQPAGQPWAVAFETELDAPYHVRLRKTFTLDPKEYDFKLTVDIEPLPGRKPKEGLFRYQVAGPVGLPIEGEWYTSIYRNVYTCYNDSYGTPRRTVDDSTTLHNMAGGEKVLKADNTFRFAAVGTQYFASALAVEGKDDPWEYVRPTREQLPTDPRADLGDAGYDKDRLGLYDVSFRAVSPALDVTGPLTHEYAVYNGPLKIRLLKQLTGDRAVPEEVVDRYMGKYSLAMLTDSHSPNWFGRRLNNIYWSDVVIASTNIMHDLLGWMHQQVGSWGLSIILLTLLIKLLLLAPSRRQLKINVDMQARIATVKPELDALEEKYKGREDQFFQKQQERAALMKKAGVNQFAQLGGCALIFLQAPILMGLYFCLQESIFFRLEPFGWITNLAAPDMLARWGEAWGAPWVSDPDYRFGWLFGLIPSSMIYLGPYFNILPLLSVTLFYVQQKITMPPPTTELEEQQRKMLKYMLVISGLIFYKFPAGLSIYFIVGGIWTLIERGLIPKPKPRPVQTPAAEVGTGKPAETPPKPAGMIGKLAEKMQARLEEMQRQAEGQRQIVNDPSSQEHKPTAAQRAESRRKKKRK